METLRSAPARLAARSLGAPQARTTDPRRLSTSRRSSRAARPRLSHCHLSDSLVQTSPIERGFRVSALQLAARLVTLSQAAAFLVVNIIPTNQIVVFRVEVRPFSGNDDQ